MKFVKLRLLLGACWLLAPLYGVAAQNGDYRIATWNMEWLTDKPVDNIPASKRRTADLEKLGDYALQLNADIIAFQEVESVALAQRVFGEQYQFYLSDRSGAKFASNQFPNGNQYTGFAVKPGIAVEDRGDIRLEDDPHSRLRFASYIVVDPQGARPLHMLALHLKAGCSGAYRDSKECMKLSEQAKHMQQWLVSQEAAKHEYVILGDFNHDLAYPGDWLWNLIRADNHAQLMSQNSTAQCKVRSEKNPRKIHQFRSLIDHIIVSQAVALSASAASQLVYQSQDVLDFQLSDHCPLSSQISR